MGVIEKRKERRMKILVFISWTVRDLASTSITLLFVKRETLGLSINLFSV